MKKDTLTRDALAKKLVEELSLKPKIAKTIVNSFFDEIRQSLIDGEDVKLSGFGNFVLKDKGERVGRNLYAHKEVKIPPRRVVTFQPSRKLRNQIQKDYRQKKEQF